MTKEKPTTPPTTREQAAARTLTSLTLTMGKRQGKTVMGTRLHQMMVELAKTTRTVTRLPTPEETELVVTSLKTGIPLTELPTGWVMVNLASPEGREALARTRRDLLTTPVAALTEPLMTETDLATHLMMERLVTKGVKSAAVTLATSPSQETPEERRVVATGIVVKARGTKLIVTRQEVTTPGRKGLVEQTEELASPMLAVPRVTKRLMMPKPRVRLIHLRTMLGLILETEPSLVPTRIWLRSTLETGTTRPPHDPL